MADARLTITANTTEAQASLDRLRQGLKQTKDETAGATKEFESLEKELGVGSRQMSLVDSALGGVARNLGVSSDGARSLSNTFKTLTGSVRPANLALGAASVALTAVAAGVAHAKRQHDQWIQSVIEGHRRVMDYAQALQQLESAGYAAAIAGATDAERSEMRLARARELANRTAVGSIEDLEQARQRAHEQLEAQHRGEETLRRREMELQSQLSQAHMFNRHQIELELAQTQRAIRTSQLHQRETQEFIGIIGELRREREQLSVTNDKLIEQEEKLAEALRAQAIAASSRAKEEQARRAAEARRAAARAEAQRREAEAERERLRLLQQVQRAEEQGAALIQRLTEQTMMVRQQGLESFEALRQRFMSEEERREELLQRLQLDSFKTTVDTQTELMEILNELNYTYDEERRNELLQRAQDLRQFAAIQLEIEDERNRAIEEEDRRHKEFLIEQERDLQRDRDRIEADRLATIKRTEQAIEGFTTGSMRSMVNVYAGASKEMAKQRRQALGDGLMAEGLSNIISAPVRFWTQGPQAAAISAGTGAAQVAFGKSLGGTLGYRGSSGGASTPDTNAPSAAEQTNITETNNVTNNILVGDPREWNRDVRRADRQGERLGMRGI